MRLRVAVVGAIGIEKGYEYLLACARHVTSQRLAMEFVVVGHTCDDKRLLDTGAVQITGGYEEAEAVGLIRSQDAELGFLPALWPETWSYPKSGSWMIACVGRIGRTVGDGHISASAFASPQG